MRWVVCGALSWFAFAAAGCLGTSPEQRAEQAQGDDDAKENELHRPGQPCLVCHRDGYSPGDDEFQVAGTVYLTPTSPLGQPGATVEITDAAGRVATATTNAAGNFMFEKGEEERGDDRREGRVKIPYRLGYPLRVAVRFEGIETVMESVTWREGSCAHCHRLDGPAEDSEPRVYVMETAP